ncbi:MAG: inducible mutagenesis protein A [Alphaproteobacteria bacterium]|nr:inducible mutagenesis protein A [Alphaproteobacteria bacterium]
MGAAIGDTGRAFSGWRLKIGIEIFMFCSYRESMQYDLQALRQRIAEQERGAPKIRPGVPLGATALDNALPDRGLAIGALHELLPVLHGDFAATIGFGFGLLTRIVRTRPGFVLWVLPSHQAFRQGAIYPVGLAAIGFDPDRLIQLSAPKTRNVLWALEEGLGNSALAAVIGVLPENDRIYDFTASRRLAMRAAENGVTALLIRNQPTSESATAAEMRWSVAAEPSETQRRVGQPMPGLGAPRWQIQLTKCKRGTPGRWLVEWDRETFSFRLAAPLADRTPARVHRVARQEWATVS